MRCQFWCQLATKTSRVDGTGSGNFGDATTFDSSDRRFILSSLATPSQPKRAWVYIALTDRDTTVPGEFHARKCIDPGKTQTCQICVAKVHFEIQALRADRWEEFLGQTLRGHGQTDSDHDTVHAENSPCWAEAGNRSWLHKRGIAPPETPKIQFLPCPIEM